MIKFNCPNCGQLYEFKEMPGERLQCWKCESKFNTHEVIRKVNAKHANIKQIHEELARKAKADKANESLPVAEILTDEPKVSNASSKVEVPDANKKEVEHKGIIIVSVVVAVIIAVSVAALALRKKPERVSKAGNKAKNELKIPAFEKVSEGTWARKYGNGSSQTFAVNEAEQETAPVIKIGPLGISGIMHDSNFAYMQKLRSLYPKVFTTPDGNLAFNCIEVTNISVGSPLEGKVQIGDLIVKINDEKLRTAAAYKPSETFCYKGSRSLSLQVAKEIENSQVSHSGRFSLKVLTKDAANKLKIEYKREKVLLHNAEPLNTNHRRVRLEAKLIGHKQLVLSVSNSGDGNKGDEMVWSDPMLIGPAGELPLTNLKWLEFEGSKRPKVGTTLSGEKFLLDGREVDNCLTMTSSSRIVYNLPVGYSKLKVNAYLVGSGTVRPYIHGYKADVNFPESLEKALKEIKLTIPHLPRFSKDLSGDCVRTNYIQSYHAGFLISNQNEDGSWGSRKDVDTAVFCALSLLASESENSRPAVEKSLAFVKSKLNELTLDELNLVVVFLSEVYVKYKSPELIPLLTELGKSIVEAAPLITEMKFPEEMGTRIADISLSMALLSQTPVEIDHSFVDDFISMAAVHLYQGVKSVYRPAEQLPWVERYAKYLIAEKLTCSTNRSHFSNLVSDVLSSVAGAADISDTDNLKSFIWMFNVASSCDKELYKKHRGAMAWKLIVGRNFAGGVVDNGYSFIQSTSSGNDKIWLRTAAHLMAVNGRSARLLINGRAVQKSGKRKPPIAGENFKFLNYYIRNYQLASETLGENSPEELKDVLERLQALKDSHFSKEDVASLVTRKGKTLAEKIYKTSGVRLSTRARAIELILGAENRISVRRDEKSKNTMHLKLSTYLPFRGYLAQASGKFIKEYRSKQPFASKTTVKLLDTKGVKNDSVTFKLDSTSGKVNWRSMRMSDEVAVNLSGKIEEKLRLGVMYSLGRMKFKYLLPLRMKDGYTSNNSRVQLSGKVTKIQQGYAVRLALKDGRELVLPLAEGVKTKVQQGDEVTFDYVSYGPGKYFCENLQSQ